MSHIGWAMLLQYARLGLSALVVLLAARFLSLAEIGLFAMVFAPVRLVQNALRIGFSETVILSPDRPARLARLTTLAVLAGAGASAVLFATAMLWPLPLLLWLAPLPALAAIGAVPEGLLRKHRNLRALAIRTCTAQSLAAALAILALWQGLGATALAAFALVSAATTTALSCRAMPLQLARPPRRMVRALLRRPGQIAARDVLASGFFPLAQLAVGGGFGLAAAGAFQMAVRLLQLTETLTVAPLRLQVLPLLRARPGALPDALDRAALIAFWAWPGLWIAAPDIVALTIGPAHAGAVTPVLRALIPLGMTGALCMPVVQALSAQGATGPLLARMAGLLAVAGCTLFLSQGSDLLTSARGLGTAVGAAMVLSLWPLRDRLPRLSLPVRAPLSGALMTGTLLLCPLPDHFAVRLALSVLLGSAVYLASLSLMRARPRPVLP